MKKINSFNSLLLLFAALSLLFVSCEKNSQDVSPSEGLELYTESSMDQAAIISDITAGSAEAGLKCATTAPICGDYKVYPLIAGQKYYAGALVVYNDTKNLYVTYYSYYFLKDFHLYVGKLNGIPLNSGKNPVIGQFPYKDAAVNGMRYKTFTIPLSSLPDCYTLAAHAVYCGETIWAKSCYNSTSFATAYGSSRWGWIINDCITKCGVVEEKILALKSFLTDTLLKEEHWVVLNNGQSNFSTGWCNIMSTVTAKDGDTYDFITQISGTNYKIGSVNIQKANGKLTVNIVREGFIHLMFHKTYVFYGTKTEFDALVNGCPEYTKFPYTIDTWAPGHQITINY